MAKHNTPLSPKQQAFVREYLIDLNSTGAALRAGYSAKTSGQIGYSLLSHPAVSAALSAAMTARATRTEITADRVLKELGRIAFLDPRKLLKTDGSPMPIHELDDDTAAALAGMDVLEEFEGSGEDRVFIGYTKKFKLSDKVSALGLAMRHLGMLKDKVEHSGTVDTTPQLNIILNATPKK